MRRKKEPEKELFHLNLRRLRETKNIKHIDKRLKFKRKRKKIRMIIVDCEDHKENII